MTVPLVTAGELGEETRDGIVQAPDAGVKQHEHRSDAGDDLGDRGQVKDGIKRHGARGLLLGQAERARGDDGAVAGDECDGTGVGARAAPLLHQAHGLLQPLRIEALVLG